MLRVHALGVSANGGNGHFVPRGGEWTGLACNGVQSLSGLTLTAQMINLFRLFNAFTPASSMTKASVKAGGAAHVASEHRPVGHPKHAGQNLPRVQSCPLAR